MHSYYVYILTNKTKTVLYIGVTNNLYRRLNEHNEGISPLSFTNRYKCKHLIFYEIFSQPNEAINREKQLKRWSRFKKERLIEQINPNWDFLEAPI